MSGFGKLVCAPVAALCLFGPTAVLADDGSHSIRIVCEDARLAALCDEIAQALADKQAAHRVEVGSEATAHDAHLTIRFVTARFSDSVLAGHLIWRDSAGRTGAGTQIDLTVMDATIDDEMMRDYARQLLNLTDLPL